FLRICHIPTRQHFLLLGPNASSPVAVVFRLQEGAGQDNSRTNRRARQPNNLGCPAEVVATRQIGQKRSGPDRHSQTRPLRSKNQRPSIPRTQNRWPETLAVAPLFLN